MIGMSNIIEVVVFECEGYSESYKVGVNDVTEIRHAGRKGLHNDIPYIEVYKFGQLHSEYCQHNITGVYYDIKESL
jgi:hypothetical protein